MVCALRAAGTKWDLEYFTVSPVGFDRYILCNINPTKLVNLEEVCRLLLGGW